jgi:hypothetical protein
VGTAGLGAEAVAVSDKANLGHICGGGGHPTERKEDRQFESPSLQQRVSANHRSVSRLLSGSPSASCSPAKMGGGEDVARQIDAQCEEDYKTNL